jgi:hypothetical protein
MNVYGFTTSSFYTIFLHMPYMYKLTMPAPTVHVGTYILYTHLLDEH